MKTLITLILSIMSIHYLSLSGGFTKQFVSFVMEETLILGERNVFNRYNII